MIMRNFRVFGARLAARSSARLPHSIREAVFQTLCDKRGRNSTFAQLAAEFHVVTMKVRGEYGDIQGNPRDLSILGTYAETGRWAERTNKQLTSFFAERRGGTYLDIGANIGLTTIPIAQNPTVSCIAFEPEPGNYDNLVTNVATNCPHRNVETRRVALFSRKCSLPFEIASENMGDHRIRLTDQPGLLYEDKRRTIEVEAVPLDDLALPIVDPLAVKIDTQGAEPFVIAGGERTIGRAELLIMEFCPYMLTRMAGDTELIFRLLESRFSRAGLAWKEGGNVGNPRPISEVIVDLRDIAASKRNEPFYYLDIVAWK